MKEVKEYTQEEIDKTIEQMKKISSGMFEYYTSSGVLMGEIEHRFCLVQKQANMGWSTGEFPSENILICSDGSGHNAIVSYEWNHRFVRQGFRIIPSKYKEFEEWLNNEAKIAQMLNLKIQYIFKIEE